MEAQLRLLRRFEQVLLGQDNDEPGAKFAKGALAYLERYVDTYVLSPVTLSEGADLGDYMSTKDPVGRLYDHLEQSIQDDVFRFDLGDNRR